MLISIGRREAPRDLTGLLLECHGRIRHFTDLAVALAASEASAGERAAAAASIARYFAEALPLHARDEEESVLPRLRGRGDLDDALDRVRREHAEHGAVLTELVAITRAVAADPCCFPASAPRLLAVAGQLRSELLSHIEHEERVVLPMIRKLLSDEEQRAILAEMRARRG